MHASLTAAGSGTDAAAVDKTAYLAITWQLHPEDGVAECRALQVLVEDAASSQARRLCINHH
jgi:hypothetical protein